MSFRLGWNESSYVAQKANENDLKIRQAYRAMRRLPCSRSSSAVLLGITEELEDSQLALPGLRTFLVNP